MDNVKETAEFFRCGLLLGLHSIADAMVWIDAVLLAEPDPDIALIEASLSGSHGLIAVAGWLGQVPGIFDSRAVAHRLFSAILVVLRQDPAKIQVVAHWLYQMALDKYVPAPEAEKLMWYFDDAISLAVDGVYGHVDELRIELKDFLTRYEFSQF